MTPERVMEAADRYARAHREQGYTHDVWVLRNALKAEIEALDADVRGRVLAEAVEHVERGDRLDA